jgi:hypothetical protein
MAAKKHKRSKRKVRFGAKKRKHLTKRSVYRCRCTQKPVN